MNRIKERIEVCYEMFVSGLINHRIRKKKKKKCNFFFTRNYNERHLIYKSDSCMWLDLNFKALEYIISNLRSKDLICAQEKEGD